MSASLEIVLGSASLGQDGDGARLVAELSERGLSVLEHGSQDHPVLLVGAELHDAVRRARARGFRRIIAVTDPEVSAWPLLDAGASDVLADDSNVAEVIEAKLARWATIDEVVASDLVRKNLVGRSPSWLDALEQLIELALFSSRSVLVTGESGTGKEMAARLVHTLGRRPDKGKLVVLDCTTIVPSLSGSELYGHARGAFTGATSDRLGAFALAHRGTLFLDEVGELSPQLQSELLRVVQEGTYKPVGSDRWERTEFRLICATNRDLLAMQADGSFRPDLYHRIAAASVRLPALRERPGDVVLLARHFVRSELGEEAAGLSPMLERYLLQRDYPGNVRDLKQLIARMCCRHVGPGPLTAGDIPEDERPHVEPAGWRDDGTLLAAVWRATESGASLRELKDTVADLAVDAALALAGGNVAVASRRLQVTERAVQLRRAARRVAERGDRPREDVVGSERRLAVLA
jgi:transcriptional regulator with GAF, ATPase, and Fis domain